MIYEWFKEKAGHYSRKQRLDKTTTRKTMMELIRTLTICSVVCVLALNNLMSNKDINPPSDISHILITANSSDFVTDNHSLGTTTTENDHGTLVTMSNAKSIEEISTEETNSTSADLARGGSVSHVIIPRSFPSWECDKELPCYLPEDDWFTTFRQKRRAKNGLFFAKLYKTGSSTSVGIHLRIARNTATRQNLTYEDNTPASLCRSRFTHGNNLPGKTFYRNRRMNETILWTTIRDPTQRAISAFFHFGVSRRRLNPHELATFLKFFQTGVPCKDYYLRALYTNDVFKRDVDDPIDVINDILHKYDFIGITERMDESAVVLMMLLNLKLADILYLNAKTNGGYDGGGYHEGCTFIQPSFLSSEIKEYIESDEWRDQIRYDVAFYQAVNQSLDLTIDRLGRREFEDNLQKFLQAKKYANDKCLPTTVFPCDREGVHHQPNETDCLWGDSGCGTTCLDEVATELNLW